jgi:hypothetical protein
MATSHPEMFQPSIADENEILKLVKNRFLPDRAVLQWRPTKGEDIPTPNTKEIMVLTSFLHCGFNLTTYEFLRDLRHHYQIELVHLNPNSIIQIAHFVHLCKSFSLYPQTFLCSRGISS